MALLVLGDAAQLTPPQMWVLIGLGIIGLIYLSVLRPMMRKRKDPLEKPPGFASLSQQRSVERQMQNLLVELSEMTRQITSQLDTRAARLEALISQADQRIQALQSSGNGRQTDVERFTIASEDASSSAAAESPDPRHQDVYALSDQGRDPHEIAAQLGRPRGEVELILALRAGSQRANMKPDEQENASR